MSNDTENFSAEDMPYVSEHLSQVIDGAMDRSAISEKIGEKMFRMGALEKQQRVAHAREKEAWLNERAAAREDTEQSRSEVRPESDPAPYGFDAPLDAEDHRTDADKLEDGLERIFGKDEAEQPQRPAPKPKAAKESPKADAWQPTDPSADAMWSAQEAQIIGRCEMERQLLDRDIAEFNHHYASLNQVQDPAKRADYEYRLALARREL